MRKTQLFFLFASFGQLCLAQSPASGIQSQGDSLKGFDVQGAYSEAISKNLNTLETERYIGNRQRKFIEQKYHLPTQVASRVIVPTPVVLAGGCNNIDFENANFIGWVGALGYDSVNSSKVTVTSYGISTKGIDSAETSCSAFTLVTKGIDSYTGLPMHYPGPGSGAYSVRLGGENENIAGNCLPGGPASEAPGEYLERTFVVSPANAYFTYNYSVLLNDGGHPAGQQPFFRVDVLDSAGHPLSPCLQYLMAASAGAPPAGFMTSSINGTGSGAPVFYCNWTSNSINLRAYIGHNVTIRFSVAGCSNGGHFGYAYLDAFCDTNPVIGCSPACAGSAITLTAPAGGSSYSWTGPGITGSTTTQSTTVNVAGSYHLTVTTPASCTYTIDTTLVFYPVQTLSFSSTTVSCVSSDGTATVTPVGGNAPYTYTWSPTPGAGQGTPTASLLSAGVYSVTVTSANGCVATGNKSVSATSSPTASLGGTTMASCDGSCSGAATVTASGGTVPYTYSWAPSGGTAATGHTLCAGTYLCTITDSKGCTANQNAVVTQMAAPTIGGTVTAPISGPINSGWVYLVHYDSILHRQHEVDSAVISNGSYTMNAPMSGNFFVYALANATNYPNVVKTYSVHASLWDSASIVVAPCGANQTANITMYELAPTTGSGSFAGTVVQDPGFSPRYVGTSPIVLAPGDPVPGLDVNLEQHPGGIIAHTTTNNAGYYHFGSVPAGTFEVFVDIPGLGMISAYQRTVTSNQMFTNLNYRVDSAHVYPDSTLITGVTPIAGRVNNEVEVSPNPFRDNLNIGYSITGEMGDVLVELYNVLGDRVYGNALKQQYPGTYSYRLNAAENKLAEGVYMLQVTVGGKTISKRVVCIR